MKPERDAVTCLNCSEEATKATNHGPMCDGCAALLADEEDA